MKAVHRKIYCDIEEFRVGKRFNIILFGYSGVGKSSIINTIANTKNEFVEIFANVREEESDQCTVKFRSYAFNEDVVIFDTCGLCKIDGKINYSLDDFNDMIDGKIKPGQNIMEGGFRPGEVDGRRVIDVVIFVFDEDRLKSDVLKDIKPFFDASMKKGRKCLSLVTKLDLSLKKEKIRLLQMEPKNAFRMLKGSENWDKVKIAIRKGISPKLSKKTYPIINYDVDESETNEVVSFICKKIVRAITDKERVSSVQKVPFFVDLFEKEEADELKFVQNESSLPENLKKNNINKDEYKIEMEKAKNLSTRYFIVPKIFYRCLKLGDRKFRFFLVSSILHPSTQYIGVFCRKDIFSEMIYFQATSTDPSLEEKLNASFKEVHNGYYEFLSVNGPSPDPKGCKFMRLLLNKQKPILLRRKDFCNYTGYIEHSIQLLKKNSILEEKTQKSLKLAEEVKKELKPTFEALQKDLISKLDIFKQGIKEECNTISESIGIMNDSLKEKMDVGEMKTLLEKIFKKVQTKIFSGTHKSFNGHIQIWNVVIDEIGVKVQNTSQYFFPEGKYLILWKSENSGSNYIRHRLRKNGSEYAYSCTQTSGSTRKSSQLSKIVVLKGTDYLEFYQDNTSGFSTDTMETFIEILKIN